MSSIKKAPAWTMGVLAALLGCDGSTTTPMDVEETVASVSVTASQLEITTGDTIRLTAQARNASGSPMTGRVFSWTSDRDDIASVDGGGLVTGQGEGLARITASTGGRSAYLSMHVVPVPPVAPTVTGLNPASIQAGWGQFTLVVTGSGFVEGSRVSWNGLALESIVLDATEIRATVTPSHVASEGSVEIGVETPSLPPLQSNVLMFTVFSRPAHTIELRVPGNAVFVGNWVALAAVARDQFGEIIVGKSIEWTSSDTNVARIQNGHVLGLAKGTVFLTASAVPTSASMTFSVVTPPPVDVAFDATSSGFPELFVRPLEGSPLLRRLQPPGTFGKEVAATVDGTRLAFVGVDGTGNHDIYVINRDGSGLLRLTSEPAIDDQPAWSPNGEWIAFRSFRQGKSDIWLMRADGTEPVNLTYASAFIPEELSDGPEWSPDGLRIVFSRGFGIGQSLFTIRPDGTGMSLLSTASGADRTEPAWSPNGQLIAFRSYDRMTQMGHVMFASPTTGEVLYSGMMPANAGSPAWLDDDWIAVTAPVYTGSATRSVALIRLTSGHQVVPVDAELGGLANPARVAR